MKLDLKPITAIAAGMLALASAAPASAVLLTFENVQPGASATSAAALSGISFLPAAWLPKQDEFGDDIPGSERWVIDPDLPLDTVRVEQPEPNDYGPAPSPYNALDARLQPTLLRFDTPWDVAAFSVTLDNKSFGNLTPAYLLFLDQDGGVLAQLYSDQTVPGYVASLTGPVSNVSSILLPSGAFYDNLAVTAVPEPSTYALLGSGLALLGAGLGRRRREVPRR